MGKTASIQFHVAIETVRSALTLMTRSISSAQVPDAVMINRRIQSAKEGSPEMLVAAITSLNSLASQPKFDKYRKAIGSLADSLPCLCVPNCTHTERRTATRDIEALILVARSLNAPDVASKLREVVMSLYNIDATSCGSEEILV